MLNRLVAALTVAWACLVAPACADPQYLNIGPPNGGQGDTPYAFGTKINANTADIYARLSALQAASAGYQALNARLTALSNGAIDGVVFGGTTPAQATFTTLAAFALTLSTPLPLTSGGCGAATAAACRTNLGLGGAALLNVGTAAGTVADGGALTTETTRAQAAESTNATAISAETTRATTAEATKAAKGANTDITSLAGLTTPLSGPQGGTGYVGVSAALDGLFSSTQGAILYRGASAWSGLAPGTSGQMLTTGGAGANPSWTTPSAGAAIPPLGQAKLSYSSTTALLVKPFQGNQIWVNGSNRTVPSAGVTCSNTGLTAATLYYVYLAYPTSYLTCELSTTSHVTDTTYGFEEKSGDATRSLVGMVYTGSGTPGTFVDAPATRYTRSWFNDQIAIGSAAYTTGRTFANTSTFAVINAELQIQILAWTAERVEARFNGTAISSTSQAGLWQIAQDGTVQALGGNVFTFPAANAESGISPMSLTTPSEGLHTFNLYAYSTVAASITMAGDAANGYGQLVVTTAR